MPSSLLFGINNEGRVHTLSTTGSLWRELPYVGQEFKKLSGVPHFLWAIGGDHQVYLYVHGLDIPIRVREEAYENERWIPIEGFSSRLLPTDRYHFSSMDGTVDRAIDRIRLPSMAWQWEGEWQLELTLQGQPLDHNGWTYAVDFPAQYHPKKQWKSCVRRRLWARSRRYSAMNSWCAVAPLHKDATSEPFIDISIGGQTVVGAPLGTLLVWAVTAHGRVMFRTGVSTSAPEGLRWNSVQVPPGCEVNQLSVGPMGLLWATLLDGRALVRIGVTGRELCGTSWVEVRSPALGLRLTQVSVGTATVWAVSSDKRVWFRKGIRSEGAGISEDLAAGQGWVEMVGNMSLVSVASNDQVWAVGADDRAIYFRMGVTHADLTGKRWRILHAPLQVSRASSSASLHHRSCYSLNQRPQSICETTSIAEDWESRSAPTTTGRQGGDLYETQLKNPKAWSPVRSVGSVVGCEAHPDSDESVWHPEGARDSSIFDDDDDLCWAECERPSWSWVEAGACLVCPPQLPNWFVEAGNVTLTELEQPWRLELLDKLRGRPPVAELFPQYPSAIDMQSWTRSSEARVQQIGSTYEDCILELEWVSASGTLTVLTPDGASVKTQFSLEEISCVQSCSEPGSPRLALHTPHLTPSVLRLHFPSDTELEEWQSIIASVCNQIQDVQGYPVRPGGVWAVTALGEVFAWEPLNLQNAQQQENDTYATDVNLSGKEPPVSVPLSGGCSPGTVITVNGCVADDCERFAINLNSHGTIRAKAKGTAELQCAPLHFNPRFTDGVIVRNNMSDDLWGEEEREGGLPLTRGQEFSIKFVCDSEGFVIFVNDEAFARYKHRHQPQSIHSVELSGKVQPFSLKYESPTLIVSPVELYWRQLGGHLRRVETCEAGVTWAIGCDHTAWVYTGGWGGGVLGTMDSYAVNQMTDSRDMKVYENQRWNPVTGYSSTGLPTDRAMWSDATGKQKRSRDHAQLPSRRWHWLSDWLVDFGTPGGVDRDGWQFAVDFPATYHATKHFTDYVRRRRWYRRCAINTSGPWSELGHTKLVDVSLRGKDNVVLWALASGGQPMMRTGVTPTCPAGTSWEHVSSPQAFCSISVAVDYKVWAVARSGCAYFRSGITDEKPQGENWCCIEPPVGSQLQHVSAGSSVWVLDSNGKLYVRKEVSQLFPEGTHWLLVSPTVSFRHVSAGNDKVWAVDDKGELLVRHGISPDNQVGTGWNSGIAGNWQHISVRALQ